MRYGALALPLLLAGCRAHSPLPVYGEVAPFHLVSQDGQPFDSAGLAGKAWVANFIYTTCSGPCPLMSYKMHRVQEAVAARPDVRLVSFTVDPAHDTPPVLAAYARRYQARDGRWFFLTGETATLNRLARYDFKLNNVDGTLEHSTRFVLVDGAGRIRGYYQELDPLLAAIARIQGERG